MSHVAFTAGYQGESIDQFMEKMTQNGVELVIDVRRLAHSRKKGFSKAALADQLSIYDIEYIHIPELGMPDDLRGLRGSVEGNSAILDEYDRRLTNVHDYVVKVATLLEARTCCLICFEANFEECHRSRLATKLKSGRPGLQITHI